MFPVSEGSVVRIAPGGARAYRNTGDTPLHYIVLQARQGSLDSVMSEDGCILPEAPSWPVRPD